MKPKSVVLLPNNPAALSTKELVKALLGDVTELVKTEVELARTELKRDLKTEAGMAAGLGAGALLAYAGIVMLFVTVVLALGAVMPAWGAGLLVTGLLFAAAAASSAIGWAKRVRHPLERTRREAQATLALAKERIK
jgi:uncharacterized membrane protein YqjE